MKRLMIIADHPFVVAGIRSALRQAAGFDVVGVLDGRRPACGRVATLAPEVLVVDDMERGDDTLKRLREVRREVPQAMLILLTVRMDDDGWLEEAFAAGAHAAVSRDLHPVALGTLLRETVQHNVVHRYERPRPERPVGPLTAREVEILGLVAQGHTNLRIARELWITEQTVKFHLSNTYRKLGVANRTEACRHAYLHDMVAAPVAATVYPGRGASSRRRRSAVSLRRCRRRSVSGLCSRRLKRSSGSSTMTTRVDVPSAVRSSTTRAVPKGRARACSTSRRGGAACMTSVSSLIFSGPAPTRWWILVPGCGHPPSASRIVSEPTTQ